MAFVISPAPEPIWTKQKVKLAVKESGYTISAGTEYTLLNVSGSGFLFLMIFSDMNSDLRIRVYRDGELIIDILWNDVEYFLNGLSNSAEWFGAAGYFGYNGSTLGSQDNQLFFKFPPMAFKSSLKITIYNPTTGDTWGTPYSLIYYTVA